MTTTATLSPDDRQAISDVLHRFFWLVDHGRAGETGALFTADARLTMGPGTPKPGTIEGPAIAAMMRARATQTHVTTRHVISNVMLEGKADGTARCYSLLTFFRSDDETRDTRIFSVADIDEIYAREDGVWKIRERILTPVFNRV